MAFGAVAIQLNTLILSTRIPCHAVSAAVLSVTCYPGPGTLAAIGPEILISLGGTSSFVFIQSFDWRRVGQFLSW